MVRDKIAAGIFGFISETQFSPCLTHSSISDHANLPQSDETTIDLAMVGSLVAWLD